MRWRDVGGRRFRCRFGGFEAPRQDPEGALEAVHAVGLCPDDVTQLFRHALLVREGDFELGQAVVVGQGSGRSGGCRVSILASTRAGPASKPGGPLIRGKALPEFSKRELRDALGKFATGVTVVTTEGPNGPLGITANSFASVSLDPPLVLWSPARKSRRFPAFEAASHFAVHVLSSGQRGLAERFSGSEQGFEGLDVTQGIGGVPLLAGCAARFECRHAAGHDGGDHLIVVGEVLRVEQSDRTPLVFWRGGYHTPGLG